MIPHHATLGGFVRCIERIRNSGWVTDSDSIRTQRLTSGDNNSPTKDVAKAGVKNVCEPYFGHFLMAFFILF